MSEFGLDFAIVGVYFTVIIGIGLYASRGQKTMESYAMGDRSMPWWAVLASILASEISAGTFLGTPGEGFAKRNFLYAQLVIGTILARLLVAAIFIKPFYHYNVVSIYEFLEIRFGKLTRRLASFVFLLTRSLASGSRIFIAAILLVLGWEVMHPEFQAMPPAERFQQELIIYAGAVVLITVLTAVYTTFGGIKAVVWTDLIQVSLMFGAAIYVFFWLLDKTGGWSAFSGSIKAPAVIDTGIKEGHSLGESFKFILTQEYTIWAALLGSIFTTLATHGTDQDMVQRMLTSKDAKRGQRAVILSGLVDLPVVIGFLAIGILIWKFYQVNPDRAPTSGADIFPWFMIHDLKPGVRGLIAAGLFATAMGSLSTALNALATTFTKDWYVGVFRPNASSAQQMRIARLSTVGFSILLAGIGIGTAFIKLKNPELRIIPIVLGSFGYTYGSLLGVFLVGMLTKTRGTCQGNLIAMLAGFAVVGVLTNLPNDIWNMITGHKLYTNPDWLPMIAFTWRIMAGTLVTVGVALCFRKAGPPDAEASAHAAAALARSTTATAGPLPPGQVGTAGLAIGSLSLVLSGGLAATGWLARADHSIAKAVGAKVSNQLGDPVVWLCAAIGSYGLALAMLAVPGQWRRCVLAGSALIVIGGWAPVLSLAAYEPRVSAVFAATLWSAVCTLVYASRHRMPADG